MARTRLALLAFALAALPAASQDLSREQELSSLRVQINRLQTRLARLGHERQGLRAELSRLDMELELQQIRVDEALVAGAKAEAEFERLQEDTGNLEQELAEARRDLRGVLVRLYRTGDHGYLRLLVSLEEGDELLDGVRQLRFLAQRDMAVLQRYGETAERLAEQRDLARAKAEESAAWLEQVETRRQELTAMEKRQRTLLAAVEREHRDLTVRAERLVEREQKLAELIDMLSGRLVAPPQGTPIARFRGVLDWPIQGRVTQRFGPRLDPRYGTRVPHNGVELATTSGGAVRAIYGGTVLYAAPFEGYGLTAIVLHPGRVFTLYAGLRDLRVAAEDVLSLGQVVGVADDRLYFEIRVENRPENPVDWLR